MQYTSVITLELHFIMAWAVSTVIQQLLLPKSELNVWGCTTGNLRISICTNLLHSRFNCCVVFRLLQNCLLLPIYSTVHTSISFIQFCQHELGGVYFILGWYHGGVKFILMQYEFLRTLFTDYCSTTILHINSVFVLHYWQFVSIMWMPAFNLKPNEAMNHITHTTYIYAYLRF